MAELPINKIVCGDAFKTLKELPAESIDMVITSPPYFGLRVYLPKDHPDYKKQIGLEPTFQEYQNRLLAVISEIKRVLKKTGSFWLNMGDCYGTGSGAGSRTGTKQATNKGSNYYEDRGKPAPGEPKCLMMMPERIALAMINNGWILRNKIKWAKQVLLYKQNRTVGSVMPTSVKDRFNESGEELFFFVKSKKYYFDLDAVRLPSGNYEDFNRRVRDVSSGRMIGQPQFKASEEELTAQVARKYGYEPEELCPVCGRSWKRHASPNAKDRKAGLKREFIPCVKYQGKFAGNQDVEMFNSPRARTQRKTNGFTPYEQAIGKSWHNHSNDKTKGSGQKNVRACYPAGKNIPTIWQIGSEPHNFQKETGIDTDHFATFPEALCEIPILAGCPKNGIVLDPFSGSGTVGVVCKKLGRNYILIDLSEKYCEIARNRLRATPSPLF